jgi:CarD family transcriptional regulator
MSSKAKNSKTVKPATRKGSGKKATKRPAMAAQHKAPATKKLAAKKPEAHKPAAKKPAAPPKRAAAAAAKPAAVKTAPHPAKPVAAKVSPPKLASPVKAAVAPKPSAAVAPKLPAAAPVPQVAPVAVVPVKKPAPPRSDFKVAEHIVYPAHGVGRIVGIETQEVAGIKLDLFVISFIKDKMTLRVPVAKANTVGMRKLADAATVKRALETVRGRARIKRTMWSRRAQEYEAKINSGDLIAIAEVVRDLFRSDTQPEQSYSERQLYEAALDRMSREISSVNKISETEAIRQIEQNLAKSPRRGAKPEGAVEPGPDAEDAPQEEAA